MFRIRRIYDDLIPIDRIAIAQVQAILRSQFPAIKEDEIIKLPEKLHNPLKYRFRSILFVADDVKGQVKGFAFVLHDADYKFCYLDFISAAKKMTGRGIGGALYERVVKEALSLNTIGLLFECLPDDPALSPDPVIRKQNISRLKFYENFGARPIINTAYETPLNHDDTDPPYLVFDNLGQDKGLSKKHLRKIIRAILERKYGDLCPVEYVDMVVASVKDDPVKLREPLYVKTEIPDINASKTPADKKIVLVVNDKHMIHHVKERGYVESPIRIKSILKELDVTDLFETVPVKHYSDRHIRAVHDGRFVDYLRNVCKNVNPGKSIYPYVFPIRNSARPPKDLPIRAGYYCIDTFTPLNKNAYLAAVRAVDCTLTAANLILEGRRLAYSLVRPPGHHAEHKSFGGFCYFNSNAIAANYLSTYGKVAILDVDYHHGNGQQDIFYKRSDILTVSIHGHPRFAYPYFSGFEDEKGIDAGEGFNHNIPLPEKIDGKKYSDSLDKALKIITKFKPQFLIIALGLDPAKGDPTGSWDLQAKDFESNGIKIGALRLPTLVVQEGGYNNRNLGINARYFFSGLWKSIFD
ncbi:MAG: GNAT family N-acetyltransferase [Calditrichaceae bacterium]